MSQQAVFLPARASFLTTPSNLRNISMLVGSIAAAMISTWVVLLHA
jgi:hypothetical protein